MEDRRRDRIFVREARFRAGHFRGLHTLSAHRRALLFQASKRDRVAQGFGFGNAVLPLRARWSAQEIGRARLQNQRGPFPFRAGFAPEPEPTGRDQRDADYVAEDGAILVPADRRANRVFGHENVRQFVRREAGKPRGDFAQRQQERRYVEGRLELALSKIIVQPEREDAAFASIALKLEFTERQGAYML